MAKHLAGDGGPNLTSTYEAKDSTGQPLRPFVVPGIIVGVDKPVVLTPNTMLLRVESGA